MSCPDDIGRFYNLSYMGTRDARISPKPKPGTAPPPQLLWRSTAPGPACVHRARHSARRTIPLTKASPRRARHKPSLLEPRPGKKPGGPEFKPDAGPVGSRLAPLMGTLHFFLGFLFYIADSMNAVYEDLEAIYRCPGEKVMQGHAFMGF